VLTLATFFGGPPQVHASAPGRVNLLGEHTDYNDGFMLPVATPQCTEVAMSISSDQQFHLFSATTGAGADYGRDDPPAAGSFASYIDGCVRVLEGEGVAVPPLRIYVSTQLPVGAGLSSSAALEVATLRALRELLEIELDDVRLARLAQRAEVEYAHVNCGIMDQMASSLADPRHMLFIDARNLAHRLLAIPAGSELIVIDTGIPRTLAASKYNERRAECEEAARLLGVPSLRDVSDPTTVEALPAPYRQRARHVVWENLRVLEAVGGVNAARFGALMDAGHASLRDDYEVSIPELDALTEFLRETPDVYGARLTGAGFGGACVALCRDGRAHAASAAALARYDATGQQGRILIPVQGGDDEPV
jgi:galactokinase